MMFWPSCRPAKLRTRRKSLLQPGCLRLHTWVAAEIKFSMQLSIPHNNWLRPSVIWSRRYQNKNKLSLIMNGGKKRECGRKPPWNPIGLHFCGSCNFSLNNMYLYFAKEKHAFRVSWSNAIRLADKQNESSILNIRWVTWGWWLTGNFKRCLCYSLNKQQTNWKVFAWRMRTGG